MRLFKAILLLMLVASIVPTLMVGWLSVSDARRLLVRDTQELAQERVQQLRLKAERAVEEPVRAVVGLARVPRFLELSLAEQRTHVASVLTQQRDVLALTVFRADGARVPGLQAFAVADVRPTQVAAHEARARTLLPGLAGLGAVAYSPVDLTGAEPVVTVAFPVGEPVRGYVAADLTLSGLRQRFAQERVGSAGAAYVADGAGRLLAESGGRPGGAAGRVRPEVARHLAALAASSGGSALMQVGHFGRGAEGVVVASTLLPETGWAVVSEQPVADAYRQVAAMERRLWWGVGAAILVAVALAASFSRTLTRPLKGFVAGALELAHGKFGTQVKVAQKNELGELAQTFNYMSQQLLAYDHETRALYQNLEEGYLQTIVALANSIDSKDAYTRGHSQRVADVAVEIGRELGMPEAQVKLLQYGGILHDIGKIGIAEPILCKQSRLTDEEMDVMRGHPEIGDTIVAPIGFLAGVRACVRSHHERWDGTGYPDRLKGKDIPLVARVVACADTFDACTSTRPYQKAMPLQQVVGILDNLSGKQLDPDVVAALRRVLEKKGVRVEGRREPVRLAV